MDLAGLLERLRSTLPAECTLHASAPGVFHFVYGGSMSSSLDIREPLARGETVLALCNLLSWVQDEVVISIREPWPRDGGNLALPQVERHGAACRVWYGSRSHVVLDLGSVAITAGGHSRPTRSF